MSYLLAVRIVGVQVTAREQRHTVGNRDWDTTGDEMTPKDLRLAA